MNTRTHDPPLSPPSGAGSAQAPAGPSLRHGPRRALTRGRWIAGPVALLFVLVLAFGPRVGPAADQHEPRTREFTLTATEIDHEIMPGTTVRAWAYNGQVPGPEIRVREGDHVKVTLRNELPVGTTIHWHGVNPRPEMDGPAGLNQAPVEPGEEFVYDFIASPGGSRWYHSHTDPALQVALGMYGPLIVEPREGGVAYDREFTYMLAEWDLELTPEVAAGKAPRGPRDAQLRGGELGSDLFLMNGHAHDSIPRIKLAAGERVLIRVMNAGNLPHAIHSHGHSFTIVATDGNPVPEAAQMVKDTVLIGPAERYDMELVGDNPGVWMFHCHMEHHMANGMMTLIQYDGEQPTGPVAGFFDKEGAVMPATGQTGHDGHASHHGAPESNALQATPTATTAPSPAEDSDTAATGNVVEVAMVDDRFDSPHLEITAGTTVVWVNKGGDWHSVASFDGSFQSAKLAPGETFSHTFDTPGAYLYLCRHHGLQGMTGKVTVT